MHRMRDLNLELRISDCRQERTRNHEKTKKPSFPLSSFRVFVFPLLLVLLVPVSNLAAQQLTADQQAEMVINSARKAYNERNLPFAVTRFREFLSKFPNHKDAASAHYGLALSLLELPEADFARSVEQLQPLAGHKSVAHPPTRPHL